LHWNSSLDHATPIGEAGSRLPPGRRFEDGHVRLQRRRDIEAMLTRAGLRVTSSRHVWLHIYALVGAERPAS
jgi:hypothetical protein